MSGGTGSDISWPSKSCSALQTYSKSNGESLERFNTRVIRSDIIYRNLWMQCGKKFGGS